MKHGYSEGTAFYLIATWEFPIFLAAADCELLYPLISLPLTMPVVMILQVYAMWNQSKRILYILLVIHVPQGIVSFVFQGIYINPNTHHLSSMYVSTKLQAKLESHMYSTVAQKSVPMFACFSLKLITPNRI